MSGGASDTKGKSALEFARNRQRRFKARREAKRLTRITVWVPKEDAEELKLALGEPGAFERLREDAMAGLQAELTDRLDKWMGSGSEKSQPPRVREALAAAAAAKAEMDACLGDLMQALEEAAADEGAASEEEGGK